jgi:phage terminase small subunit
MLPTSYPSVADATVYEDLTALQNNYVFWRQQGLTAHQAAKRAGYENINKATIQNENHPKIKDLVTIADTRHRIRYEIDRDRIVEGIMEALSVAREQSEPKVMIQAWTEIARITGVQAPEVKRVEFSGRVTQHHYRTASDQELLALVGRNRELPAIENPIEAEYEEIITDNADESVGAAVEYVER